jgi:hypothetical protein
VGTRLLRLATGRLPGVKIFPSPRTRRIVTVAVGLLGPRPVFGQGWEVPKPAVDLKAGIANYKVTIEARGETATMDVTRTTRSDGGNWVVTNTTHSGKRVQTDEITVEKKTLIIRRRVFHAGDASADLTFNGHMVTGTIGDSTKRETVNADLGGVVFADGSGGEDVLAALPLAKAYSTEFRNYNIGSLRVKTLQLRVMDIETISVPAGTFDTWKVIIAPVDGGSDTYGLWVDRRTHRVIKVAISAPDLGDALATAELTSFRREASRAVSARPSG